MFHHLCTLGSSLHYSPRSLLRCVSDENSYIHMTHDMTMSPELDHASSSCYPVISTIELDDTLVFEDDDNICDTYFISTTQDMQLQQTPLLQSDVSSICNKFLKIYM